MVDIDIKEDLDNLKKLDKTNAILVVMHLLDAAELLTASEPKLALLFTNFANTISNIVGIVEQDIEDNRAIIADILQVREKVQRVQTHEA